MTVTDVRKDPHALTMTLDAEFDALPERVWQLWSDPRQLERWWGPPTYPEGDTPKGFWEVQEVDPPHSLAIQDGFANEDGSPNTEMPVGEMRVTIEEIEPGRTRMSILSIFPSSEAMEQLLAMGQEEGMTQAVGQIDAILAEDTA
jgi:uncharacterized protein YndB with AHSA1/START domain